MAPEYHNHILMDGHSEPVACIYSATHPRMPKPPNELLQADPLKYLKTFLVLLRPSRLREPEQDYSPIESDLISTEDRKQAIAWVSRKLINIMNDNAELERQVKNQGPRRTKVLGSEVYQSVTLRKMREEEWHGSDFLFCLTEAMKRLPKEEIKNTRFMLRLGRSPLNGVAARCAADTTSELGLSLREWINARCVNGNGSRMNLLCKPIDDAEMRNHALALNSAPLPPTRSASASARVPIPQPPYQAQQKQKQKQKLQPQPQPKSKQQVLLPPPPPPSKNKGKGKKRRFLNSDDGDSGDHASDSDYAQPARKKTATAASTPKSRVKANAKAVSMKQQKQQKQRIGPASPVAARHGGSPATPAGKQIRVKEEVWSSYVVSLLRAYLEPVVILLHSPTDFPSVLPFALPILGLLGRSG
ncbi:hypothetical protein JOL62DRAFT_244263 [Phyllosticta paracitricarpa]|uniref:Uncharacterized protein n=2 Tax=Phyllosticta TaxID=121621 RepID=A0ABR1MPT2_9PEZI